MRRIICFITVFMISGLCLKAQISTQNQSIEGGSDLNIVYHKDYTGQIYAHTRGLGVMFRKSKMITSKQRNYYEIDFCNMKHPKEVKVSGDAFDRKRFVYGKLNNVMMLKGALGSQWVFYTKADPQAVEVRYSYSIGPGIGFLKPYYVQVNRMQNNSYTTNEVKFNEDTFTIDSVMGRASFFKGFDELKVYPVITGKFNISFEYAHYTNIVRALEAGICVDYFPKAVSIMARNPSENLIITLRLGFVFGRKFY